MTEEKMQFMVKAATDSYMANLDEQDKRYLSERKELYVREYFKVFEVAMTELKKQQNKSFQPFGEEENSKSFK